MSPPEHRRNHLSSTDYHHSALLLGAQIVFFEGQNGSLILLHTFRPAVKTVGNAIHWKNQYPGDKCFNNQLNYPLAKIYQLDSTIHILTN